MYVSLEKWADEHGEDRAEMIQGEEQTRLRERLRQDYGLSDFIKIEVENNNTTDLLQEVITSTVAKFNQFKNDISKLSEKKLERNINYYAIDGEIKAMQDSFTEYITNLFELNLDAKQYETLKNKYIQIAIDNNYSI